MPNYMQLVTEYEASDEAIALRKRMDDDYNARALSRYFMQDSRLKRISGLINITLNRPAVFYANVFSALQNASEQIVVEAEDTKLDTAYIEDSYRKLFYVADGFRELQGLPLVDAMIDEQSCIRGRVAVKSLLYERDGNLIIDLSPWDTRYTRWEPGKDGLKWAAYHVKRVRDRVEAEYGSILATNKLKLRGAKVEVLDVWTPEHNEIWLDGIKVMEQEHSLGFTPVATKIVSLGSMLAGDEVNYGESLYFMIRHLIPEINRLATIMATRTLVGIKPPIQTATDGEPPIYEELMTPGSSTAVDQPGAIQPISLGDIQRDAQLLYRMIDIALQEGSLSSSDLGILGSPPPSGITLIQIKEGRDQVFAPRLDAKASIKRTIAGMLTEQLKKIGGTVEIGDNIYKKSIQTSKLEGTYNVHYQYQSKSRTTDAGLVTLAAAFGNLIPDRAKREEILQREDPDKDERQLRIEEAERLSPMIKMRRIIEALIEEDRKEEAEIMSDEMGVTLDALLSGNIKDMPKPAQEQPPKQVVSLFGGGATRQQQPEGGNANE